jgi:hypothetical protein
MTILASRASVGAGGAEMLGEEAAAGRVGRNDAPNIAVAAPIVIDPVNAVDKASRRDFKSWVSVSLTVSRLGLRELLLRLAQEMKWVRLILVVMILGKRRRCLVFGEQRHAGCCKALDCIMVIIDLSMGRPI